VTKRKKRPRGPTEGQRRVAAERYDRRRDLRRPHEITFSRYHNPGELCLYDACTHGAKFLIEWTHLHKGRIRRAKRTRCRGHAQFFAKKHGVKFVVMEHMEDAA